jgi:2-polyprenyl-3-methyl-5-hydroxy-6-metoxy-1,4-benzoquinol methylase
MSQPPDAADDAYAQRLTSLQQARWKQVLDVQRPYRSNLQKVCEGEVLEIGCGIGRNLRNLQGRILGVDPDTASIAVAKAAGLAAMTIDEFDEMQRTHPRVFGTLLFSHVLEHVTDEQCDALFDQYLPYLTPGGRIVIECPQEVGYRSDATHIEWMDFPAIARRLQRKGITVEREYSFPFPRPIGRVFSYNQFVTLGRASA